MLCFKHFTHSICWMYSAAVVVVAIIVAVIQKPMVMSSCHYHRTDGEFRPLANVAALSRSFYILQQYRHPYLQMPFGVNTNASGTKSPRLKNTAEGKLCSPSGWLREVRRARFTTRMGLLSGSCMLCEQVHHISWWPINTSKKVFLGLCFRKC